MTPWFILFCTAAVTLSLPRNRFAQIQLQGRLHLSCVYYTIHCSHDGVIKWKHFPRYWPFVRGILLSPVDFPHEGWWCGALMFSLICAWTSGWENSRDAGDLRPHRAHFVFTVMTMCFLGWYQRPAGRSAAGNSALQIDHHLWSVTSVTIYVTSMRLILNLAFSYY